jgi:hypothetical protein
MLHTLSDHTKDLIESLSALSDSVHMMRQTSLTATRRLRAVKDTLREWRSEWLDRDDGVRYIEQGCWDQRLRNRECASVCRDVLGGYVESTVNRECCRSCSLKGVWVEVCFMSDVI